MAAVPTAVVADGNLKVLWVPAIADPTAPTVAELTAAGVIDLSCYLTKDGFQTGGDEQTITDERLCSTQTFEAPGTYSDTLDLIYTYDPQSSVTTEPHNALKRLTKGHIVARWGTAYDEPITASDLVDVIPGQAGVQRKQAPESNSTLKMAQKIHVTNRVERDVAVVAGP